MRWLTSRRRRNSLKSWSETPSVPIFSAMLHRASGGDITDRKRAIAASVFKSGVRKYVASDLFDSAVNGMFNRESLLHTLGQRLKNRFSSGLLAEEGAVSEAFQ